MTDADLSAAVAQRVLGAQCLRFDGGPCLLLGCPRCDPESYATDVGACLRDVVPAMQAKGFSFELECYDDESGDTHFWRDGGAVESVGFWKLNEAPRAICLAALAACP